MMGDREGHNGQEAEWGFGLLPFSSALGCFFLGKRSSGQKELCSWAPGSQWWIGLALMESLSL